MPDQQPDKRCGTCEHYRISRPYHGECHLYWKEVRAEAEFPCWTPKPPKNLEEK